jgi:tRNA nucleotidyltransferase/poly(A) polymerase
MPDYIYLLENRLSADQQNALRQLREAAREAGTILFLTGDAVRDLTRGAAVRDLEVAVHGNALKLKKIIEKLGGKVWGEDEASRSLYLCFPGTVRVDAVSAHRAEYPKPGKSVFHSASIQEDLRRRDFTVNAMAISLNEGSFGLLMDPMNGAADIESQTLRLVSNYGFLEEPSLLIRATRYGARLGWEMEPKTRTRYENAREEGVIEHLSAQARSQELEQIGHEEEGLKVLRALEAEGWMKFLIPAWTSAKADEERLTALHELAARLRAEGVHADMSAAQMRLLTARLSARDLAALKKLMLRPGFVEEWNSLDALAAEFAQVLLAEENSTPSASYKLFTSYDPEAVLWLGFTSEDAAVQERFNLFLDLWPTYRQRLPHALMQEMRITPELPAYSEIVQSIFLELLDGKLGTPEELRAFLDPYSPPAPPPKEVVKRPRAKRGAEARIKEDSYDEEEDSEESLDGEEDLDDIGGEDDDLDLGLRLPKAVLGVGIGRNDELGTAAAEDEEEGEAEDALPEPASETVSELAPEVAQSKRAPRRPARSKSSKAAPRPAAVPAEAEAENLAAAPAASESEAASEPAVAPWSDAASWPEAAPKAEPEPKAEAEPKAAIAPKAVKEKKPAPAPKSKAESKSKSKPAPAEKSAAKAAKPSASAADIKPPAKSPVKAANPKVKKSAAKPAKKL